VRVALGIKTMDAKIQAVVNKEFWNMF